MGDGGDVLIFDRWSDRGDVRMSWSNPGESGDLGSCGSLGI